MAERSEHLVSNGPQCGPTYCRCHTAHLDGPLRRPQCQSGDPATTTALAEAAKVASPKAAKVTDEATIVPSKYRALTPNGRRSRLPAEGISSLLYLELLLGFSVPGVTLPTYRPTGALWILIRFQASFVRRPEIPSPAMCAAIMAMCLWTRSILAVLVGAVMPMRSPMTSSLRCVCVIPYLLSAT